MQLFNELGVGKISTNNNGDYIIVMNDGKVALQGTPAEVFKEVETLEKIGLGVPQVTYLVRELRKNGFNISVNVFTIDEAKKELLSILKAKKVEEE